MPESEARAAHPTVQSRDSLPRVIATSVVRSSHQGESHGGAYIIDLETGEWDKVLDWNDDSINWEGRGADRGLRGIGFVGNGILLAASDELFLFDREFRQIRSFRNRYLKHCHELHATTRRVFLTSTGFDSVLELDVENGRFVRGIHVRLRPVERYVRRTALPYWPEVSFFDPEGTDGPRPGDTQHINNTWEANGTVYLSGTKLRYLLAVTPDHRVHRYARLPRGTHNTRPFRDGVLCNATEQNATCVLNRRGRIRQRIPVVLYNQSVLLRNDIPHDHARQGFARGLVVFRRVLVVGSSPATVTAYSLDSGRLLRSVNLTLDVRHAIHGLEVWPY